MNDRRRYSTGDQAALMVLCRGGCYWPGCAVPVVVEIQPGRWVLNLQRSHIAAREPGGARYDALPMDVDRDSFGNLILLCVPHHQLVDRLEPENYPADLLHRWKAEREKSGQAALAGLANVTEDRLQELVSDAIGVYHDDMRALIAQVAQIDERLARLLSSLSEELADFRSVQYSADPDVAAMLYDASLRLPTEDTAGLLSQAARDLRGVDSDMAAQLADAASALKGINEDTISQLLRAAEAIQRAAARLPEY